jgi:hypothetical protein
VLIGVMGTANVLWLDAVSFLVSAALVAVCVASAPVRRRTEKEPYLGELKAGLGFLRTDRVILTIVIVVMLTNFLDAAFGGVILPVYVKQVWAPRQPGVHSGRQCGRRRAGCPGLRGCVGTGCAAAPSWRCSSSPAQLVGPSRSICHSALLTVVIVCSVARKAAQPDHRRRLV